MKNRGDQSSDADDQDDHAVEDGVSRPRAVGLVRQVAKIKRSGKRAAECRRSQGRDSVYQQRWTRGVVVARHFDTFQNLQGHKCVQRAQWQNDGKIFPALAMTQEFKKIDRLRQMKTQRRQRRSRGKRIDVKGLQQRNQNDAGYDAERAAGQAERQANPRAVNGKNNHRR